MTAASSSPVQCGPLATLLKGSPEAIRVFLHSANSIPNAPTVRARSPSLDRLAERALILAAPGDVVCLPSPPDPDLLSFLRDFGLGPRPEDIVTVSLPDDGRCLTRRLLDDKAALDRLAGMAGARPVRLHPFYASPAEFELAERLQARTGNTVTVLGGSADAVRHAYGKHRVRSAARHLGIPLADGEVVELPSSAAPERKDMAALQAAILRQVRNTGKAIVRGACSSTGSATFLATDTPESISALLQAVSQRDDNHIYLVDAMHPMTVSPNIQTFLDPSSGRISLASVCDQVLENGYVYLGNRYPSAATLLPQMTGVAMSLSSWLAGLGFTGLAGFDFVEYPREDGRPCFFFVEINPRINGAAFPTALREHLDGRRGGVPEIAASLAMGIRTKARTFGEVVRHCGNLLFDGSRGIFPYYAGALAEGVFTGAFLGSSPEEVRDLHKEWLETRAP